MVRSRVSWYMRLARSRVTTDVGAAHRIALGICGACNKRSEVIFRGGSREGQSLGGIPVAIVLSLHECRQSLAVAGVRSINFCIIVCRLGPNDGLVQEGPGRRHAWHHPPISVGVVVS